ncbi:6-hydroxynicotinate 3-monooxygenase precursor [Pigmentiphaga humi]|uniref:6-hydroxynicotinate 3-monooxygenase n=1 Tax=Pigmentiphaga humi TaxID=2478468 RepID=A0A3P4B4W1_9BURK|nr:NAD(P)/FAD-dependent oxidoreductase [Pigmentiphaga humi]VCU71327.1 6-hydroxynicotinate 3-monooxygenase precursor [Pigmentiphaga humi]
MTRKAEISGGGIGGLAVATMLANDGWRVRVHEQGPEIREIGAGIYVKNNSLEVLGHLGVIDRIRDRGTVLEKAQIRFADGRIRQERRLAGAAQVHTYARQTLIEGLRDAAMDAGVEVNTNSRVVGVDADALVTQDGGRHPADLIVAADGVHSTIRQSLGIGGGFTELPTRIDRFLVRSRRFTPELQTVEHWSGHRRIGVTPAGPEHTYVYMVAPSRETAATRLPLDVGDWAAHFPLLRSLFEHIGDLPATQYSYGAVDCPRWSAGRVAILGDAAHGLPPTLGQGAGLTLMNAMALTVMLREAEDIPRVLSAWEQRVRFISDRTQRWSRYYDAFTRQWPQSLHFVHPLVVWGFGKLGFLNNRMRIADRGLRTAGIRLDERPSGC